MKLLLAFLFSLVVLISSAQDTTYQKPFTFFGYAEVYYGYDFGNPENGLRPNFIFSHTHHNRVNANLVFVKFAYAKNRFRFNIAPMLGTYSQSNLSGEPFYLRQIFEANIGGKLLKKQELWLDAGVFPSHIGFESAISKDCATLSRSILADNSPYYETGIKLTFRHNEKLTVSFLVLNGWQKINWQKGKTLPSFGTQLVFTPNEKFTFNHSTFIGTDNPDIIRKMRYFNNLYAIWNLHKKVSLTFGFDIGAEQKVKRSTTYNLWYSPVCILRFLPVEKLAVSARYEFYSDIGGVMIATVMPDGFQTHGASLNLDYIISEKVVWRAEGKMLFSKDKIFILDNNPYNYNLALLTSLAISLSK